MTKEVRIGIRFSPKERRVLERAAKQRDLPVSTWAREVLRQEAGRQLFAAALRDQEPSA